MNAGFDLCTIDFWFWWKNFEQQSNNTDIPVSGFNQVGAWSNNSMISTIDSKVANYIEKSEFFTSLKPKSGTGVWYYTNTNSSDKKDIEILIYINLPDPNLMCLKKSVT